MIPAPHASVKRHRSGSEDSTSSSVSTSNKRTSSPAVSSIARMNLNDGLASSQLGTASPETNMQDEGGETRSSAIEATDTPPEGSGQLAIIKDLTRNDQMKPGDTYFVVHRNWYRRWQASCGDSEGAGDKELDGLSPEDVGPIDNSSIANVDTGKLTKRVTEGQDAVFIPAQAYQILQRWYGTTGKPIERTVIRARDGPVLDLHPPLLSLSRLVPANSPVQPSSPVSLQASSGWLIAELKVHAMEALGIQGSGVAAIRIWHLPEETKEGIITADKLAGREEEPAADDEILRGTPMRDGTCLAIEQQNADGTWMYAAPEGSKANGLPSATPAAAPIFGGGFFDKKEQEHAKPRGVPPLGGALDPAASSIKPGNSASTSMRQTRSQTGSSSRQGLTGLSNMGNTCFMNSALQCLSNTPALQQYFQTGFYREELNPDNPLGMNGEVAKAFGNLIEQIWSGNQSSITPRNFKSTLSKFAPAFSGWQQHDSQELIAFLLDGLHEDLNRIKKKPYDDIPDWEGGGDKEEMSLANTSWELYKRRNDSVIVDLFQGQYRSRLTCPECGKVAIKFDPFMYLSLAIPQNRKWEGSVYVIPRDAKRRQIKVSLEVPLSSSIKKLKQAVGERVDIDPKTLFAVEEFSHKFYKVWSDVDMVSEFTSKDIIIFFEFPYAIEQPRYRSPKSATPDEEGKHFVSVYSCKSGAGASSSYGRHERTFGEPFVLALTREEACSLSAIEKRIGERLQSWQGVGDKVWTSGVGPVEPNGQKNGKARIADDEEEDEHDAAMTEPSNGSSSVIESNSTPGSLLNPDVLKITIGANTNYRNSFTDFPSERRDLSDRVTSQQTGSVAPSTSTSSIPGSFGADEQEDLYEDGDAAGKEAPTNGVLGNGAVEPEKTPLVRTGETIVLEWSPGFVTEAFGNEAERTSRTDNGELFSLTESLVDPAILNRRRGLGNKKQGRESVSVESLLDEFVKEEKLSEDNMWYCPSCKKHQEAPKKFDLWKMPDVLVIHLKRFSNERAFRDKIDTLIDFPVDGLDLSDRVEGKKVAKRLVADGAPEELTKDMGGDESLVYDLFAVDNHFGGLGGGHYTAFAKNIKDGKWYNFDDSRVSSVSAEDVKTSAAYLLFYRRRTDKPIGGKTHEILASQLPSPSDSMTEGGESSSFRPGDNGSQVPGAGHLGSYEGDTELERFNTARSAFTMSSSSNSAFSTPLTGPPSPDLINVSDDDDGLNQNYLYRGTPGGSSRRYDTFPYMTPMNHLGWDFAMMIDEIEPRAGHVRSDSAMSFDQEDDQLSNSSIPSLSTLTGPGYSSVQPPTPPQSPPVEEITIQPEEVAMAAGEVEMEQADGKMDQID